MFNLDLFVLNYLSDLIFPWSNHALFGFGIYAKYLISLKFGQQVFNILYDYNHKGGKNKCSLK